MAGGACQDDEEEDGAAMKQQLCKLVSLDRAWRQETPKETKVACDSFVLSLVRVSDSVVIVGLNNGRVEEWDLHTKVHVLNLLLGGIGMCTMGVSRKSADRLVLECTSLSLWAQLFGL